MTKFVVLLLFTSTAFAADTKFHFRDHVKVISGFYRGCTGTVNGLGDKVDDRQRYLLTLTCDHTEVDQDLLESELELCKGKCNAN